MTKGPTIGSGSLKGGSNPTERGSGLLVLQLGWSLTMENDEGGKRAWEAERSISDVSKVRPTGTFQFAVF